ncbi:STAS domain-containing protein [Streptomyces katrae]|uniref:STAS domain-containing protein n=1 Tax=Streptomyces katrae TaxID=68223 RepID=UPI0004C01163|nr:STAS domain-containing protein [Streptomyces katrae]
MECDFRITERQYGPTVHLAPAGELDRDARPVWDGVEARIDDTVDVVVCDMARVGFMDMTGLTRLIAFADTLRARGTTLFVLNVRTQPAHVMDVLDDLAERRNACTGGGSAEAPTAALRRTLTLRATAVRYRAADHEHRPVRSEDEARHSV